jgi:CheY-like chemotaxis protein
MSGRVLIVDDDPAIRELLVDFLSDEGFEVLSAVNGKEAIEKARREEPDCILMDLNMPVLDGEAAIHQLKSDRATRSIRIYAMSARTIIEAREERLKADGTLKKPFELQGILDIVSNASQPMHD